ncbi:MAG: hypothetical protein WD069_19615 [Planctomycetales bacterium]
MKVTYEIAFSSYVEALLLVFCLSLSAYAAFSSRRASATLLCFGFFVLLFKFGVALFMIEQEIAGETAWNLVLSINYWTGPIGLGVIALATLAYLKEIRRDAAPQSPVVSESSSL